jgi:hypothetical protein
LILVPSNLRKRPTARFFSVAAAHLRELLGEDRVLRAISAPAAAKMSTTSSRRRDEQDDAVMFFGVVRENQAVNWLSRNSEFCTGDLLGGLKNVTSEKDP